MALTYDEFIKKVGTKIGNIQFCRFLNDDWNHYGFQYKIGLNEDILPFDPTGSCKPGGLYFSDIDNIRHFKGEFGTSIAIIQLLPNALYYIDPEGSKYKTNKFIIVDVINESEVFWEPDNKFKSLCIGNYLKFINLGTIENISGKQLFVHSVQEKYIIMSDTLFFGVSPYVIEFKDKKYARKINNENKYLVVGCEPKDFKLRMKNGKPIDISESNLLYFLFGSTQTKTNFIENIIKRLEELGIGGSDTVTYLAKNIDEYVENGHIENDPGLNAFVEMCPFMVKYINRHIDNKRSKLNIFRNMFVEKYPLMIQYINQTYSTCKLAVKNDDKAFSLIRSKPLINMVRKHRPVTAKN